jgi:hypothetical protein
LRPSEGLENTQPRSSGLEWPIFQVFGGIFATVPLFEAGHDILKLCRVFKSREAKNRCQNRFSRHSPEPGIVTNPVDHLIRGAATFTTFGRPYIEPQAATYCDPTVAGGGQIYAQVTQVAGYLTFLTGARRAQVFARFHNDGCRMDIFDVLNVELENGCLASIASTSATPREKRLYEIRIYGTKACLFMDLWCGTLTLMRRDGGERRYPDLAQAEIFPERAPAQNLVDSILGLATTVSPWALGLASMEVVDAACESARTGLNIKLMESHR